MESFNRQHFQDLAPYWNLNYSTQTDSTSAQARACCETGVAESGTLFLTEYQTHGIGRRGTAWQCSTGEGLLFTAIVETELSAKHVGKLAIAAGLAVAQALKKLEIHAQLKWPNDVYINGKKVCGILVEQIGNFTLFGIGINTNVKKFPSGIHATSLNLNTHHPVQRETILADILTELLPLVSCCEKQFEVLSNKWQHHDYLLGKSIRFKTDGNVSTGIVRGISADGFLKLESDSVVHTIVSASQIQIQ